MVGDSNKVVVAPDLKILKGCITATLDHYVIKRDNPAYRPYNLESKTINFPLKAELAGIETKGGIGSNIVEGISIRMIPEGVIGYHEESVFDFTRQLFVGAAFSSGASRQAAPSDGYKVLPEPFSSMKEVDRMQLGEIEVCMRASGYVPAEGVVVPVHGGKKVHAKGR